MLKREISTTNLLIISLSSMVGSGWLFSPYISAQMAGPNALISWAIAAIFMMFVALPLSEIGSMLPVSGGMANYPTLTHGKGVGFLFAWTSWISYVVVSPIELQAVLQYASHFFPSLVEPNHSASLVLSGTGYVAAFIILALITLLNTCGIKLLAECSKYAGIVKFFIPVLTIFTLFYCADSFHHNIALTLNHPQSWSEIFSALSSGGIAFAFLGFQTGVMLAGEAKRPQRDIPFAVLGSIVLAFILYFLLQFSFIAAMPDKYLANGWTHFTFPGSNSPLVGLALLIGLPVIATLLLIDSSLSPLGTALVYTTGTSRILYSMALHKHLPSFLLKLNKYKIPYITLIINFSVGMFSFLPFPGWQKMVAFLSSAGILSYTVGPLCLPALRKLLPNKKRPFRLAGANVICYIAFYFCNLMLLWCGFTIVWKLYVALAIGLVIHLLYKKDWIILTQRSLQWFGTYITSILACSYLSSFGGIGFLAFPADMGVIFLLSIIMFYFSQQCIASETELLEQMNILEEEIDDPAAPQDAPYVAAPQAPCLQETSSAQ
jgi:amino acid transporter